MNTNPTIPSELDISEALEGLLRFRHFRGLSLPSATLTRRIIATFLLSIFSPDTTTGIVEDDKFVTYLVETPFYVRRIDQAWERRAEFAALGDLREAHLSSFLSLFFILTLN
jgi:hypothetical protein